LFALRLALHERTARHVVQRPHLEGVVPFHPTGVDAAGQAGVPRQLLEGDGVGPLTVRVVVAHREDAIGAVSAVNLARLDALLVAGQVFVLVAHHHLVCLGHHPPVEPEHEDGDEQSHPQVRPHELVEGHPGGLQGHELELLREGAGQVDAGQKQRQRGGEPDDFRDVVGVEDSKHLPDGGPAVEEIVAVLDPVQHDEEDEEGPDEQHEALQQPLDDVPFEGRHDGGSCVRGEEEADGTACEHPAKMDSVLDLVLPDRLLASEIDVHPIRPTP
jgi:hypothetical protein